MEYSWQLGAGVGRVRLAVESRNGKDADGTRVQDWGGVQLAVECRGG